MAGAQETLDRWLPTLARYAGLVLTIGLTVAVVLGHSEVAPGFVPAAGLMLYKTVKEAAAANEARGGG